MGDAEIRAAFGKTLRSIAGDVSTPTLLFTAAGLVGEVLLNIGTAGAASVARGVRAAGGIANVLTASGARRLSKIADEFPDAAAALKAIGINAALYRSSKEMIGYAALAVKNGMSPADIRHAHEFTRNNGPVDERSGLFYGYVRMRNLGWQFEGAPKYGSNYGLDAIFSRLNPSTGEYELAVLEAKSGSYLDSLETYGGVRQGSNDYITTRLQLAIDRAHDPAQRVHYERMLAAFDGGRVQGFVSLSSSERLIRLPLGWDGGPLGRQKPIAWEVNGPHI